ncbi:cytochrome c oxidase subunit II [Aliidiomarina sanyensis]|uniref:Cytochrome aa3 subunit 2 n=1 Tax=Aliidiomarina sanyensis TaxID=1249555 RepID=A0A432WKF4_9GAMM|nr:cytochrome c oxidase subunit II [Aliidiomarina sanyensis]RUO34245.1 cytochrome c oxidase subunit II [Aliidiomarina sanyensis]
MQRLLLRLAKFSPLASVLLLTGCSGPFSMLDPAGPSAQMVVWLWWGMFWFSVVVMALLCWGWWVAMQRDGRDVPQEQAQRKLHRWVWLGGIGLPVLAITLLLAFGIPFGHRMLPHPDENVVRIDVEANQWFWRVTYPDHNIELIDTIVIPVSTPIDFRLSSTDVIHSFWVPRLGGKLDAIPGRTNVLRLQADEIDTYRGLCAEYCGTAHAFMKFEVSAVSEEDFAEWLEAQGADHE